MVIGASLRHLFLLLAALELVCGIQPCRRSSVGYLQEAQRWGGHLQFWPVNCGRFLLEWREPTKKVAHHQIEAFLCRMPADFRR